MIRVLNRLFVLSVYLIAYVAFSISDDPQLSGLDGSEPKAPIDQQNATNHFQDSNTQECEPNEFRCDDGQCIKKMWECDGTTECEDESDEYNCLTTTHHCNANEFRCDDELCIPVSQRCDGILNCTDLSDEKDCPPPERVENRTCENDEFMCADFQCIPLTSLCDDHNDCFDYSDEINCTNDNKDLDIAIDTVFGSENVTDGPNYNGTRFSGTNQSWKWISQLFKEAETSFRIVSDTNANCTKEFDLYRSHLLNQSIWAVKMMESSEWPSVGLFSGRTNHLGDYDECLSIFAHGVAGKYCLAEVTYNFPPDGTDGETPLENPPQDMSVWEAIAMYRSNPARVDRQKINFALCIPSSCQPDDVVKSLNRTLLPVFDGQGFEVLTHVTTCAAKLDEHFHVGGSYFAYWIFLSIFFFVIASTYYDIACDDIDEINKDGRNNLQTTIYRSFSIVKNFRTLTKNNPETEHATIHFVKVFSMLLVIYGHRFLYVSGSSKLNAEAFEETWRWPKLEIVHEDVVTVFFMVSGFLTFYCNVASMSKSGWAFLVANVLSRWMRMIPVICIFVLYIVYILPYTSDGPLWQERVNNEVSKCTETWWAIPLAMNNWIKSDQLCLIVTWYISVDLQLAIVGGILLLIFCRNKTAGLIAAGATFVCCTVITFLVAYSNEFQGILKFYMILPEDYTKQKEFTDFYIKTYTRVGPYLVGFIGAFITKSLQDRNFKFSKKQILMAWVIGFLVSEGTMQYGFFFYVFGREYNRFENAFYASVRQSLFVSGYALFFCLHFTSGVGIFEKFFSWKGFVPFGRLTYSVYLTNILVQFYYTFSQRQVVSAHLRSNLMWLAIGDVIWSYAIGFVVYLFIEAPIGNIAKLVRKKILKTFEQNDLNIEKEMETGNQNELSSILKDC